MNFKPSTATALLAASLCTSAIATDGLCQSTLNAMGMPAVRVYIGPNKLKVTNEKTSQEITQVVKAAGSKFDAAIGMTLYSNQFSLTPSVQAIEHPSGYGSCFRQELEVNLAAQDTEVNIAKEYPKGRCGYQAILDHEMLHVDAYESFLRYLAREIESKFTQRYERSADFSLSSGWAEHQTPKEPDQDIAQFIAKEFTKLEQIQGDIDSLEVNNRLFSDLNQCENVKTAVVKSGRKPKPSVP